MKYYTITRTEAYADVCNWELTAEALGKRNDLTMFLDDLDEWEG